jgi:hypothetical protein
VGRDQKTIMRTVNLGFYLGADAKGAARADEVFRGHWVVDRFRALGCTRLSIALREGPYDWEALEAFAAEIVRAS